MELAVKFSKKEKYLIRSKQTTNKALPKTLRGFKVRKKVRLVF